MTRQWWVLPLKIRVPRLASSIQWFKIIKSIPIMAGTSICATIISCNTGVGSVPTLKLSCTTPWVSTVLPSAMRSCPISPTSVTSCPRWILSNANGWIMLMVLPLKIRVPRVASIWFCHWWPRSGIYILVALVRAEASFKFDHTTSQSWWSMGWISRGGSFHLLYPDLGWGCLGFSILASRPCPTSHGIREHWTVTFLIAELSKAGDILLCLSRHWTGLGSTRIEPSGAGMACWGPRAVYTGSHSSPARPGEGGGNSSHRLTGPHTLKDRILSHTWRRLNEPGHNGGNRWLDIGSYDPHLLKIGLAISEQNSMLAIRLGCY